jgi:precorrin-4/cobalt-precorrin-4 C11-methyltransferase
MAIYLSISLVDEAAKILIDSYGADSGCAVAYCVSQPEERIIFTRLKDLAQTVKVEKITRTALIIVGKVLNVDHARLKHRSKLYQKGFEHGYRK